MDFLKKRYKQFGQFHVFNNFKNLSQKSKIKFINQAKKIDLKTLNEVYNNFILNSKKKII